MTDRQARRIARRFGAVLLAVAIVALVRMLAPALADWPLFIISMALWAVVMAALLLRR